MRRAPLAIALAVASIALAGCATSGSDSGDEPTPTESAVTDITGEWQLTKGTDADGTVVVTGSPVTLVIADDSVSGQAPCNTFTGEATVDGTDISIGPLATTLMACEDEAGTAFETRYLAALEKVTTAKLGGVGETRSLTLTGPDDALMFTIIEKKTAN